VPVFSHYLIIFLLLLVRFLLCTTSQLSLRFEAPVPLLVLARGASACCAVLLAAQCVVYTNRLNKLRSVLTHPLSI